MSTEIESKYFAMYGKSLTVAASGDGDPYLTVAMNGERIDEGYLNVPRADFLRAVATELDVIVIDKADLPEVDNPPGRIESSAADLRYQGLRFLALAEYLDAHPPVDEARVEELAKTLRGDPAIRGHRAEFATDAIARRLVAEGWSK